MLQVSSHDFEPTFIICFVIKRVLPDQHKRKQITKLSVSMCAKQTNKNHIGQERDRTLQCASKDIDDDRPQHHGTNSHDLPLSFHPFSMYYTLRC